MGKLSRNKGNAFERLISKMIIAAVNKGCKSKYAAKDCYRTPLSGGHPLADPGDLTYSPAFAKVFPYHVECKHHKSFSLEHFFRPTAALKSWCAQTIKGAKKSERRPMLVIRGARTPIFVGLTIEPIFGIEYIKIDINIDTWVFCRFDDFLKGQFNK